MIALAIGLFVVTLGLVVWQPKGLSIGWIALGGAAMALLLRVVTFANVIAVTKIVWDATLTFVALLVIAAILDRVGMFEWAALKIARAANGDGRRVFLYVILLGAAASAFFANDGAALILTPIVLEKMRLLRFDGRHMLAFILASGFIADTASLPLVVSNLVNIISADYFKIGFVTYFVHMFVPDIFSCAASVLVLFLFFWRDIPKRYDPSKLPEPRQVIPHSGMFRTSWVILALLLVGFMATEVAHIPVSAVSGRPLSRYWSPARGRGSSDRGRCCVKPHGVSSCSPSACTWSSTGCAMPA